MATVSFLLSPEHILVIIRIRIRIRISLEGWWIFFGARGARARGTRAHVRNIPSSVLPESTVQNLESSCTVPVLRYRGYRYTGTLFGTLYVYQLVL